MTQKERLSSREEGSKRDKTSFDIRRYLGQASWADNNSMQDQMCYTTKLRATRSALHDCPMLHAAMLFLLPQVYRHPEPICKRQRVNYYATTSTRTCPTHMPGLVLKRWHSKEHGWGQATGSLRTGYLSVARRRDLPKMLAR